MIPTVRRHLVATAVAAAFLAPAAASAQTAELTLLHVNDVYEISAKRGKGGMAELMTLLRAERARAANHLTTLGGDLISPSVMSGLTKGEQMIALMNAIGLDVAGFGNHEFDFGDAILKARMAASKFTWLATNTLGTDGKPFGGASRTMTRKVGALTVGLFSVLTPETTHLSSPGTGVRFLPAEAAAAKAVKELKAAGADFIIALTHLDIAQDRALAASVKGIDIILGGHDHDPISIYEGKTLILKAGYDAHYLVAADIKIEKKETKRGVRVSMLPEWRYLATAGVSPDPEIAAIVKKHEEILDKELGVAVGKTSVLLDSRRSAVRTAESNVGNLIADVLRAGMDAEVGFTNGGGIRGDRTYEPGTTLTRKDVLGELPFGNVVVLLELSGNDLLAALENGVSRVEDKAGRFPHVSGMRFVYDPKKPKGSRVVEAMVGGQPLDPGKRYRVATNEYIAGGGDGYAALTKGKALIDASAATLMATMVMDYIAAEGTIAPKVEGRITAK
ncbi:MAG: 5'-nucleotidase C-terminal domain-containing protein [Alphaproteobacteria bacterium]|jgi:2',3'-cyclic-nucleotide 2'-phosphodiesterase (5'-nucleotidase family)|nr:5'-nucleotidase C-terminal domain-containing protein [Alphaproteobacteria bacterium]